MFQHDNEKQLVTDFIEIQPRSVLASSMLFLKHYIIHARDY